CLHLRYQSSCFSCYKSILCHNNSIVFINHVLLLKRNSVFMSHLLVDVFLLFFQLKTSYVKSYLLPDRTKGSKRKTSHKKETCNPVFDEEFKYHILRQDLASRTLQVSVWHYNALGVNLFLGEILLPLAFHPFDQTSHWYTLAPISWNKVIGGGFNRRRCEARQKEDIEQDVSAKAHSSDGQKEEFLAEYLSIFQETRI
ncbi:unnamed protein product, partial [Trichobilharzia regenti]